MTTLAALMRCPENDEDGAKDGQPKPTEIRRRAVIAVACSALVVVIDIWLSFWLIPWVDRQDWARTNYGSVGFALFFLMVFFTFLAVMVLISFYFSRSSYPADKWQ
jgi:hypothetical protein